MPSKPPAQNPEGLTQANQQITLRFQQSTCDTGVCNAYAIDRHSLPGFLICTFGTVIADEVVARWTFALEPRLVNVLQKTLQDYLVQIHKQVQLDPFIQPKVPIARPIQLPRPADWIGAARQENTAEFVLHCWSWHAAAATVADKTLEQRVQTSLYVILRSSLAMQISWIAELYDTNSP